MVQHHYVCLSLYGGQGVRRRGAAIDADDEGGAAGDQGTERVGVGAVALGEAVRHVGDGLAAQPAQEARHECAAAGTVHVVIAEHRDRLAALHRVGEAGCGARHIGEHVGVGHQGPQGRLQEVTGGGVTRDAAAGQQAADDLRHAEALGDAHAGALQREPRRRTPDPAPSAEAARHAEGGGDAPFGRRGVVHHLSDRPRSWW